MLTIGQLLPDGTFRHTCQCGFAVVITTPRARHMCKKEVTIDYSTCRHLGDPIEGETVTCQGCSGSPHVHQVFACEIHGKCVWQVKPDKVTTPEVRKCQAGCGDFAAPAQP